MHVSYLHVHVSYIYMYMHHLHRSPDRGLLCSRACMAYIFASNSHVHVSYLHAHVSYLQHNRLYVCMHHPHRSPDRGPLCSHACIRAWLTCTVHISMCSACICMRNTRFNTMALMTFRIRKGHGSRILPLVFACTHMGWMLLHFFGQWLEKKLLHTSLASYVMARIVHESPSDTRVYSSPPTVGSAHAYSCNLLCWRSSGAGAELWAWRL
jgi:hypothetical protein